MENIVINRHTLQHLISQRFSDNMVKVFIFLHSRVEDEKYSILGVVKRYDEKALYAKYRKWTDYKTDLKQQQFKNSLRRLESLGYLMVIKGENEMMISINPNNMQPRDFLEYVAKNKKNFVFNDEALNEVREREFWISHRIFDLDKFLLSCNLDERLHITEDKREVVKI